MKMLDTLARYLMKRPRSTTHVLVKGPNPLGNADLKRPDGLGAAKIAVLKLDQIGDFVTAINALERLRRGLPEAQVTLICTSIVSELAELTNLFDRVVAIDHAAFHKRRKPWKFRAPVKLAAFPAAHAILAEQFDLAIDLRHDDNTRHMLFELRAGKRAGFSGRRKSRHLDIALPEMEKWARRLHLTAPSNSLRLVLLVESVLDSIRLTPATTAQAWGKPRPFSPQRGPFAVVAAGAKNPVKRWSTANWRILSDSVIKAGYELHFIGSSEEAELIDEIVGGLPQDKIVNHSGMLSLLQSIALIEQADFYIGLDTGLSHIASALGKSSFVLFSGHADPDVWSPRGERTVVIRTEVSCSPCGVKKLRQCSFGLACMNAIEPQSVWETIASTLARDKQFASGSQELRNPRIG